VGWEQRAPAVAGGCMLAVRPGNKWQQTVAAVPLPPQPTRLQWRASSSTSSSSSCCGSARRSSAVSPSGRAISCTSTTTQPGGGRRAGGRALRLIGVQTGCCRYSSTRGPMTGQSLSEQHQDPQPPHQHAPATNRSRSRVSAPSARLSGRDGSALPCSPRCVSPVSADSADTSRHTSSAGRPDAAMPGPATTPTPPTDAPPAALSCSAHSPVSRARCGSAAAGTRGRWPGSSSVASCGRPARSDHASGARGRAWAGGGGGGGGGIGT
jgi:hypothetical protein